MLNATLCKNLIKKCWMQVNTSVLPRMWVCKTQSKAIIYHGQNTQSPEATIR